MPSVEVTFAIGQKVRGNDGFEGHVKGIELIMGHDGKLREYCQVLSSDEGTTRKCECGALSLVAPDRFRFHPLQRVRHVLTGRVGLVLGLRRRDRCYVDAAFWDGTPVNEAVVQEYPEAEFEPI